MLLNNLINQQQDRYNQFQAQIELLQEEQRKIQAYLQNLGSIESKMESAASLVAEAIAEINNHCPEELEAYKATINSLFGSSPIAQLEPAIDEQPEPQKEPSPTPQEPPTIDLEPQPTIDAINEQENQATSETSIDSINQDLLESSEVAFEQKPFSDIKLLAKSLGIKITSKQATIKAIIAKTQNAA